MFMFLSRGFRARSWIFFVEVSREIAEEASVCCLLAEVGFLRNILIRAIRYSLFSKLKLTTFWFKIE